MPEEIEGRELSARFRQSQLYIPKFYKDMFVIKEGDYFVLEVVKHSHAKTKYKPAQNSGMPTKEKKSFSNSQPPLTVPNLMDDSDFPSSYCCVHWQTEMKKVGSHIASCVPASVKSDGLA